MNCLESRAAEFSGNTGPGRAPAAAAATHRPGPPRLSLPRSAPERARPLGLLAPSALRPPHPPAPNANRWRFGRPKVTTVVYLGGWRVGLPYDASLSCYEWESSREILVKYTDGKLWILIITFPTRVTLKELRVGRSEQDFRSSALLNSHWILPSSLNHSGCLSIRMTTALLTSSLSISCLQHILSLLFADLSVFHLLFSGVTPLLFPPHCMGMLQSVNFHFVCLRIVTNKPSTPPK